MKVIESFEESKELTLGDGKQVVLDEEALSIKLVLKGVTIACEKIK